MKKFVVFALVASLSVGFASRPAFALKPYSDAWVELYTKSSNDEGFKKLVGEAKCNVCHVDGADKKKVRNPYGEAVHKLVNKKEFPVDKFKSDPAKTKEAIEAAFKKIEAEKAKDGKTFGEKIKAGQLPGGDTKGK